jgi:plastocyanin
MHPEGVQDRVPQARLRSARWDKVPAVRIPSAVRPPRRAAAAAALIGGAALLVVLGGCEAKRSRGDLVQGKQLFVAKCGVCHVLNRAGTTGVTGPNLDEAFQQSIRDGFGRSTIRGVVREQILYPNVRSLMYQQLKAGKIPSDERQAYNIAAYVAAVAAKKGQDTGALAKAVENIKRIPLAKPQNGMLEIDAFPTGDLKFIPEQAEAPPGPTTIRSQNKSSTAHNISVEGPGTNAVGPVVSNGGVSQVKVTLKPGTYTFLCTVPGHAAAGMKGPLIVK